MIGSSKRQRLLRNEDRTAVDGHVCKTVIPEAICEIKSELVCNGVSQCVTDECNCGNDVFQCRNGWECVSLPQVSDERFDDSDGSDECGCLQYLNCASQTNYLRPSSLCDESAGARNCDNETVLEAQYILHDIIVFNESSWLKVFLPYKTLQYSLRFTSFIVTALSTGDY